MTPCDVVISNLKNFSLCTAPYSRRSIDISIEITLQGMLIMQRQGNAANSLASYVIFWTELRRKFSNVD